MRLGFTPPGAISAGFMAARDDVNAIMGPVGSGKTSVCVMRILQQATEQAPSPVDGVRYSKWAVVRDTYRNLSRTTVKTWKTWLGKAGHWTGGGNEPATLHLRTGLPDGSVMDLLVEFMALGEHSIEDVARGWEGTGVWLNEADLLPPDVLSYMFGRCGRYPSAVHGGATWRGAIMDYNAPDAENYCYALFEDNCPDGYRLFKQPGGRDPAAENLNNLPDGYYDGQVQMLLAMGRDDLVRRLVDNLYGYSRDGKPVYPEYRDDFHCAGTELMPVKDIPVRCDFDQGLHPAVILRQVMPDGQLRVLDELYSDGGASDLCRQLKALIGSAKYHGCRVIGGMCDPAAAARDGKDAEAWIDTINRLMGWRKHERVRLADTNDPDKRQAAVRFRLTRMVGDARPGLLISSTVKILRKGFNSLYRFKRVRGSGGGYADKPDKKWPVADVHDALQYGALDDGGFEEVIGREKRRSSFGTTGNGMMVAKVKVSV